MHFIELINSFTETELFQQQQKIKATVALSEARTIAEKKFISITSIVFIKNMILIYWSKLLMLKYLIKNDPKIHYILIFSVNLWLSYAKIEYAFKLFYLFLFTVCISEINILIKEAYIFSVCSEMEIANKEQVNKHFKRIDISISSLSAFSSS